MTLKNSSDTVEPIVKLFGQVESAGHPRWLLPLRKAGLARFAELGFPTLDDEDWRFTNIAPIAQLPFHLATPVAVNGAETKALDAALFNRLPGNRLVFVNGYFVAGLSRMKSVAGGVRIENLATALANDSTLIEKHLGQYAGTAGNAFAALNQAFFSDGAFISVPAGVAVEEPVQLV